MLSKLQYHWNLDSSMCLAYKLHLKQYAGLWKKSIKVTNSISLSTQISTKDQLFNKETLLQKMWVNTNYLLAFSGVVNVVLYIKK